MSGERWEWAGQAHPGVIGVLAEPAADLQRWCHRLETETADPTVGKVLCVVAASAVAREVLAGESGPSPSEEDALDLLARWIDDPSEERFERICSLLLGEGQQSDLDLHEVVWWALRTATSSVGNFEAGWALEAACRAAVSAGLNPEQLRGIVEEELLSRLRGVE